MENVVNRWVSFVVDDSKVITVNRNRILWIKESTPVSTLIGMNFGDVIVVDERVSEVRRKLGIPEYRCGQN